MVKNAKGDWDLSREDQRELKMLKILLKKEKPLFLVGAPRTSVGISELRKRINERERKADGI